MYVLKMFSTAFLLITILGVIEGHRLKCKPYDFRCFNGICIHRRLHCNGRDDCGDNSDERYCNETDRRYCAYEDGRYWEFCNLRQICYPNAWKCDGLADCLDGSDERSCRPYLSCTGTQLSCLNGKCIPRRFFCDGENDCGDQSDEKYCDINKDEKCPLEEGITWIRCSKNKRCYPSVWKCDGRTDCQDGSDENNCPYTEVLQNTTAHAIQSISGVEDTKRNLTRYFLNTKQSQNFINKWGPHITKTAVALFLSDEQFFAFGNRTGEDIALEMSLNLISKLGLMKKISIQELSFFINAMTVACVNPRDFFGLDMVSELRKRVNDSKTTNPFSILALCNAKDLMTQDDIEKLQQLFYAHHRPVWTDAQAMIIMALACIRNRPNMDFDERMLNESVVKLKRAQHENGTVDNLKTTALVVQALLATKSYETDFNLSAAVLYMMHEVKNTYIHLEDLYYILPIMSSKSLIDISSDHCVTPLKTDLEVISNLQQAVNERIQVQISIYVGDDMDFVRTWKIKVPSNYSLYQALESIGILDPRYKIEYSVSEGKPYVAGLNNFRDSIEENTFWFIYTKPISSTNKPELVEQSPVEIQVSETEEVILWYRSALWADS